MGSVRSAFVEVGATRIHYRETGDGTALVFLHGGWGYEVYPLDRQIAAFSDRYRILIPDRPGYGRSSPRADIFRVGFHERAAAETLLFLDALEIGRAVVWGHSDGAVIAALLGLIAPTRVSGLILEAAHYTGQKHGSEDFFRAVVSDPASVVGQRAASALARDHGEAWPQLLQQQAAAWLDMMKAGGADLYQGRLSELAVPALILHGSQDPRSEPGELDALRSALPRADFQMIEQAGHSPHSEPGASDECTRILDAFLSRQPKLSS